MISPFFKLIFFHPINFRLDILLINSKIEIGGKGFFYSGSLPLRSRRCFKGDDCFNMLIFHRPACGDDRLKSPLMINVQIPPKWLKITFGFFFSFSFLLHFIIFWRGSGMNVLFGEVQVRTEGEADPSYACLDL